MEELKLNDFIKKVKKVSDTRIHKIKNSIGVYDIYKHIRKNKWYDIPRPLKEKEFYSIVRRVNKYLADNLSQGIDINLPHRMGSLEIRKTPSRLEIVNGKLVTNLPIDWDATLKLWYEDPECYRNHTLVKIENDEIFRVYYNKLNADYTNKSFYEFRPNREIKKKLTLQARKGRLEAFLLHRYD